jgi:sarcosine oxidase
LKPCHVAVVGAGVFGAWCAWVLAERKDRVTLIDAYGPANPRASSADHSRVIRCGYGADDIYSRWAHASMDDWRALETRVGRRLVVPSGALFLGRANDGYINATKATLERLGYACEALDVHALRARFPQLAVDGIGSALLERDAGIIRAREAVQALVRLMVAERRINFRLGRVAPMDERRPAQPIRLTTGETLDADATVFACGPWLPELFPEAVGPRIRATRQEVLHFGVPPGDDRFSLQRLPVWIDFEAGLYGIPDFDARGFKVGVDRHGPLVDPDTLERIVTPDCVTDTRGWLARRFPVLAQAPLVDARVCQYENTHNGDLVIDRHPAREDVWIVGGGSGHGFKHGPAVGRHVAALVEGSASVEPRFALAAKRTSAARAVY